MVSVIPSQRSSWDVIGESIGKNLSDNLPGAVNQGYQRQLGMNALQQAEKDIAAANGDPYKIAMAFAKAGAQNPNLERSLGPLANTAMAKAQVQRAFPPGPGGNNPPPNPNAAPNVPGPNQMNFTGNEPGVNETPLTPQANPSNFATPGPFNIMTGNDIDAESRRYADAVNSPAAFQERQAQLNNQNNFATQQRKDLENAAIKNNVAPSELSRFMVVGSQFDSRNPSEWVEKTKRAYAEVKSNYDKLERAFIPGLGNALMGENRDEALKRTDASAQSLMKMGLEDDAREFFSNQYLSPTEVEERFRPLTPGKEKAIKELPRGLFPMNEGALYNPSEQKQDRALISYEEAREKAPRELAQMQNQLTDFFVKNVDKDTSLLVLRDALVNRDYDWRQIGPALAEAQKKGLKLTARQGSEVPEVDSQAPYQSIPDIFKDWERPRRYRRGQK